jgi:hypothetical protein
MLASTRSVRAVRGTLIKELIARGLGEDEEDLCRQLQSDDSSFDGSSTSTSSSTARPRSHHRKRFVRKRSRQESSCSDDNQTSSSSSAASDSTVDSDFSAEESEGHLGSSTDSEAEKDARDDERQNKDAGTAGGFRSTNALMKRHRHAEKIFSNAAHYLRKPPTIQHEYRLQQALQRHSDSISSATAVLVGGGVQPLCGAKLGQQRSTRRRNNSSGDMLRNSDAQSFGDTVSYHSSKRVLEKTGFPCVITFSRDLPSFLKPRAR